MNSKRPSLPQVVYSVLLCFCLTTLQAQMKVGQPAGSPDPSSALDVSGGPYTNGSTYRGIAPPKVALTQTSLAAPISSPTTGLLVYNTSTTNDVTPGYYYWEGAKWVRISTVTSVGAARLATGGGQFMPTYLLADLPTMTTPYPDNFILVDRNKEGIFSYDASDTSTPPDNAMVVVVGSRRYKRVIDGQINVKWFGAKGDGDTSNVARLRETNAINAASAFVSAQNNPAAFRAFSPSRGFSNTLFIPHGVYSLMDEITIKGSMHVVMEEATSYGGTRIIAATGKHLFHLRADTDGVSVGTRISGGILLQGSATSADVGLIFGGGGTGDGNNSSLYIERVTFRTPERWAVKLLNAGDVRITNCTFDVIPFSCIEVGDATHQVDHINISGNTFFAVSNYCVKINNARGVQVLDNAAYTEDAMPAIPTIFVSTAAGTAQGVTVSGNTTRNVPTFAYIEATNSGVNITGNTTINQKARFLQISGGGVLYGANISNNVINNITATPWTSQVFDATGSGIQGSIIKNNTIINGTSTTAVAMVFPDARTAGNDFSGNKSINFASTISSANADVNSAYDNSAVLHGENATGTSGSTNANEDRKSGFYSTTDVTNLPNSAGWFNLGFRARWNGAAGSLSNTWDVNANPNTHKLYSRFYFNSAWTPFKTILTTDWFNVDEAVTNTANTVLANDGTQWTNRHILPANSIALTSNGTLAVNTKYVANGGAQLQLALPLTATEGDVIVLSGFASAGWRVTQRAGEQIVCSQPGHEQTTLGTSGYIQAGSQYDHIVLEFMGYSKWRLVNVVARVGLNIN